MVQLLTKKPIIICLFYTCLLCKKAKFICLRETMPKCDSTVFLKFTVNTIFYCFFLITKSEKKSGLDKNLPKLDMA